MPSLDTHVVGDAPGIVANAFSLTGFSTDTTNEVVGVFVVSHPESGGTPPTVHSITDTAGLSFTRRFRGTNGDHSFEYWTAPTAAKLTSDDIAVFLDRNVLYAAFVFAVTGCADINDPFDGNVSVPGFANPGTGTTTATPAVSTNAARTLTVILAGVFGNAASPAITSPFAVNDTFNNAFQTGALATAEKNQQVTLMQAVLTMGGVSPLGVIADAFKGPGWLRFDTYVGGC